MATVKLAKWGNSIGLRLPKHVIGVCFRPVDKYTLAGLVSAITDENRHGETDWDVDAGREQW